MFADSAWMLRNVYNDVT